MQHIHHDCDPSAGGISRFGRKFAIPRLLVVPTVFVCALRGNRFVCYQIASVSKRTRFLVASLFEPEHALLKLSLSPNALMTTTPPPAAIVPIANPATVYPVHARCGLSHPPNQCPLPFGADIGFPFKASHDGQCGLCGEAFICTGDLVGRTTILQFADMGYQCRACVLHLLTPYYGPLAARPLAERVEELIEIKDPPPTVAETLRLWALNPDYNNAILHSVMSGPGTCKTTLLAMFSVLHGPRKVLNLAYNAGAASALREMGAVNSHTFHSLGMRSLSKGVLRKIRDDQRNGLYSLAEAPKNLQLTLVAAEKTSMIMSYLHPRTAADPPTARTSLVVRVFSGAVSDLYSAATNRGFGMPGPNLPLMSDIPALMSLARILTVDVNTLEPAFGTLRTAGDIARIIELASTAEVCVAHKLQVHVYTCLSSLMISPPPLQARLMFCCALLSEVHEVSLMWASQAAWTTPGGEKLLYVTSPISGNRYRLPCCTFDEQVTCVTYLRTYVSAVGCKYVQVNFDEVQDMSQSKVQMLIRILESSDRNGGPGWGTRCWVVGDDDQVHVQCYDITSTLLPLFHHLHCWKPTSPCLNDVLLSTLTAAVHSRSTVGMGLYPTHSVSFASS